MQGGWFEAGSAVMVASAGAIGLGGDWQAVQAKAIANIEIKRMISSAPHIWCGGCATHLPSSMPLREVMGSDKGATMTIEVIRHLVGGAGNRRVLQDGEMDAGAWSCGMVTGLIHDIPTCKELIDRIMAEAEAIIRSRLEGLLAA